ncbi:MAG: hypothetical protein JWQ04_2049 [Pedosphaera sp.]|nr:hypothetical protein [Pedosphaera sp.]
METETLPKQAEFTYHRPQNNIRMENREDGVVIRAARNNFSPRRKQLFIQEMAAEGFIPDHLQWLPSETGEWPGVTWIIDDSWMVMHLKRYARLVAMRLFLSASLVWLVLMGLVLSGRL